MYYNLYNGGWGLRNQKTIPGLRLALQLVLQAPVNSLDSGKVRAGEADVMQQGKNYRSGQEVGAISFEPEFREYVMQTLEPEMQSDISMTDRGDESQLTESESQPSQGRNSADAIIHEGWNN